MFLFNVEETTSGQITRPRYAYTSCSHRRCLVPRSFDGEFHEEYLLGIFPAVRSRTAWTITHLATVK